MTAFTLTALILVANFAIWMLMGNNKARFLVCLLIPIVAFAISQFFPVLEPRFDRKGLTFLFFLSILPPILNYWMHQDHSKQKKLNKPATDPFLQLFNYWKFLFVDYFFIAAVTILQLLIIWATSLTN